MRSMQNHQYMDRALEQATQAAQQGEIPVGAVIVYQNRIVAVAHNEVEQRHNPLAHAELLAIERASQILGRVHLLECDLYVTLEPCAMCAQAIAHARLRRLYYGAYDPKSGGVDHGAKIYTHKTCHFKPDVYGGLQEQRCRELIQTFFATLR